MSSSPLQRLLMRSQFLHTFEENVDPAKDSQNQKKPPSRSHSTANNNSTTSNATLDSTPAWRKWWTPQTRRIRHPSQRNTSPVSSRQNQQEQQHTHRRMPTPLLLRLHEHLEAYAQHLADPSVPHAVSAAAILDSSRVASTGTSSTQSQPRQPNLFETPLAQSHAMMALQVEWETFASPLLLLAGAEALYGQLEHVELVVDAAHPHADLMGLYRTIRKDIQTVKRELCENVLSQPQGKSDKVLDAARVVQVSLGALEDLTTVRARLVELQRMLFFSSKSHRRDDDDSFSSSCLAVARSCQDLLPDPTQAGLVASLIMALAREIKTWMALLETMAHLEHCRFMETVLAAQKTKACLCLSSSTTLQRWFRHTLERLLSLMPLYFDCIRTMASPLYGFDVLALEASTRDDQGRFGVLYDYEAEVLEFLRRQDSKGGAPMAVAIVVDAVATDNQCMERGVVLGAVNEPDRDTLDESERQRKEWKAVYMRSTVHSTVGSSPRLTPSSTPSGLFRRSKTSFRPSQNMLRDDDPSNISPGSSKRMRMVDTSGTLTQLSQNRHVLEYAPARGACSWPYTEWHRLVEIVSDVDGVNPSSPSTHDRDSDESDRLHVKAQTYRPQNSPLSTPSDRTGLVIVDGGTPSGWMGNWGAPPPPPPLGPSPANPKANNSNFHVVRLGEFITMLVIVNGEDEGKWQLRRSRGHSDEDIRSFLNDMSAKLRISSLFRKGRISEARVNKGQDTGVPGSDLLNIWKGSDELDESNAQEFLRSLKESFGLRPHSPLIDNPYRGLFRAGPRNRYDQSPGRYSRRRKQRQLGDEESAIAFFLGEDLIKSIR